MEATKYRFIFGTSASNEKRTKCLAFGCCVDPVLMVACRPQCALSMFGTYTLLGHVLTPSRAFASLSLIENVTWAAALFPEFVAKTAEVRHLPAGQGGWREPSGLGGGGRTEGKGEAHGFGGRRRPDARMSS